MVTRGITDLFTILNDCETRVGGGEVGGVDLPNYWQPVHKPASLPENNTVMLGLLTESDSHDGGLTNYVQTGSSGQCKVLINLLDQFF